MSFFAEVCAPSKENVAFCVERLRLQVPLVHCLTNTVVQEFTANVLLACGASPAMVVDPAEAAGFASVADALLVNVGTYTSEFADAAVRAVCSARKHDKPWVLDPVAVGVLGPRTDFVKSLLWCRPWVLRANASESLALVQQGAAGRGVDSVHEVESAMPAAVRLLDCGVLCVCVSGVRDFCVCSAKSTSKGTDKGTDERAAGGAPDRAIKQIPSGKTYGVYIAGGSALQTKVVGMGCALGALVAAYLGAVRDRSEMRFSAVVAAHAHMSAAASYAEKKCQNPGTFAGMFIDFLYSLTPEQIADAVTLKEVDLAAQGSSRKL